MAEVGRIVRMDGEDDPQRCQGVSPTRGQCGNKALPGMTSCAYHGGAQQAKKMEAKDLRNYRIAALSPRIEELTASGQMKDLREEIALTRYMIEQHLLKTVGDDVQFQARCPIVADLVMKVERLVKTCSQMDRQLGTLLDKTQARNLAMEFVEIVTQYIDDPDQLSEIGDKLVEAIDRVASAKPE